MQNPMLGLLNQNRLPNQMAPIKTMMNMAKNPSAVLQQMLGPQYAQMQKLISDNGGDPKKAFYSLANQMGVDPDEILNSLR